MKECNTCKEIKDISEFSIEKRVKSGLRSQCKECANKYYQSNAGQNKVLLRRFGITIKQYEQMLKNQDNKCAICKQEEIRCDYRYGKLRKLSVDHDHKTKKIRGLLCGDCNTAIGLLKEDIKLVKNAFEYMLINNSSKLL